jgi:hypothetical protein
MVRLIGRRFYTAGILELTNAIKTTELAVIPTVEILATPDMRKNFRKFFKRR